VYYPDDLVESIREKIDIVDLISSYVNIKKHGLGYLGLCPFHNEKTPSFSVSQSRQIYHCFGCGVGGNVFTFLMEYDNLTFPEAVRTLATRAGVALPDEVNSEEEKRQAGRKKRLLDIHTEAAMFYYSVLKSNEGTLGYQYFKKRQLSDETITRFGLGYSGRSTRLYKHLRGKGYTDEELKNSGLFTFDEKSGAREKFWNRVMFPIMDANNRVIAFGGRVMGDGMPKYLNSPETMLFDKSRNLYGLNYARHTKEKYFLLCEGYMDVIALHQNGFTNACASLGTALTGLQANLIKRYVKQVIITYDSDGAGTKAALRAIPILKGAGISVKILDMKPYKDPDEFIKNLGSDEYRKRIENAKTSFDFEVGILESEFDLKDPEQKTAFYNEVAKKLLMFEDELERSNYIESIAVKYNIRIEELRKLVVKLSARNAGMPVSTTYTKESGKSKKEDGTKQAQEILLTWLTKEPDIIKRISDVINESDFVEEPYKTVARMVFEEYQKTGTISPARIINHFDEAESQKKVAAIFSNDMPVMNFDRAEKERVINEIVKRIRQQSIDRITRNATSTEDLQKLLSMKAELQKMHISL